MKTVSALLLLFFLCAVLPGVAVQSPAPALGLHVKPCTQGKSKARAECGTFGVYENRAAKSGRVIALQLVVLKARRNTGQAIAFIAGGPGQSSVEFAPIVADGEIFKPFGQLLSSHDIIFVDQRGTGGSNPSHCDIAPRSQPAAYFKQLWPDALVSACRSRYSTIADPNRYTTNNATDDLDQIRAALGYRKIALFGGSYGTFFSLIFIRRHPQAVQSAVLDGLAPPHFQPLPGAPDGAQTALNDLTALCRRTAGCYTHFPQFRAHFDALVRRFDRGPIAMTVTNPVTKRAQRVELSKEVFVDQLRHLFYDPDGSSYVPYVVERAYRGDYTPLAKLIELVATGFIGDLDAGAYLSYSCAEFMPFISSAQLKDAAEHSFAGDARVRAQRRACAIWNVRPMPAQFNDIVRSNLPILILSGSDDPATPPKYAAEELPYLPNAREVVVRGAGHTTETPCTDRLIESFVQADSAKHLQGTQCTAAFTPPPFATSLAGLPQP